MKKKSSIIITGPEFTEEEKMAQRVWAKVAYIYFQCLLVHNKRSLQRTHLREDDERTSYQALQDMVKEAHEIGIV